MTQSSPFDTKQQICYSTVHSNMNALLEQLI